MANAPPPLLLSLMLLLNLASAGVDVCSFLDGKVDCLFGKCLINGLEEYFEPSEKSAFLPLWLLPQILDLDFQASN